MCTRYITPEQADIERHWLLGRKHSLEWTKAEIFPTRRGRRPISGSSLRGCSG